MDKTVAIRHTRKADADAIIALQKRVYPDIPAWNEEHLMAQLGVFPQGQILAEYKGEVVGCASSLIVLWDEWFEEHSWREITARGSFLTHNPEGRTLYGAEVCVDPELQGLGIGHALYEGRRALCHGMNLKRIIACGRLPGYRQHAAEMPPELYAKKVLWGDLQDPVLSFQLREDFRYCGIIEDYIPEDQESLGYAALIVWLNPDYEPTKATTIPREILP